MTSRRLTVLKSILWAFVGILAVVSVARFARGLGATTDLSNATPWGLWVGFDVMGGVALAAGGFVLAGTVYVFGLERFRPLVRAAVLTAFLGYLAVAIGLLYDIGLPWNIWHPAVYWQHHSVLFEVAACVMLYLTVLSLEFAPVVLEHPIFDRPLLRKVYGGLKKATIPLVITGIVLSTLHQSSLGSLLLITPYRLHPLWYSPILYLLFFVSAVGLGFMTVTLESLLSSYFLGHKVRGQLLARLGVASAVVLTLYAALRLGDLGLRGQLSRVSDGSWQSRLFLFELLMSVVLPVVLLSLRRVRRTTAGLGTAAALATAGMVLYRLDVAFIAVARPEGVSYFPTLIEFAVSLGVVSLMALIFIFFVEHLPVYTEDHGEGAASRSRAPLSVHLVESLGPESSAAPRRYTLAALSAAAVAVVLLPPQILTGTEVAESPVSPPRTVAGSVDLEKPPGSRLSMLPAGAPSMKGSVPLLLIDGNRNGDAVLFDHDGHVERGYAGHGEVGARCRTCHHLDQPLALSTSCSRCHRDMVAPVSVFNHASHVDELGGNAGCSKCHADASAPKTLETAKGCTECHQDSVAKGSFLKTPPDRWRAAEGYVNALHGLCMGCHDEKSQEASGQHPEHLGRCDTCHDADRVAVLKRLLPGEGGP